MKNKTILITGSAGFIGSNLVKRILKESNNCLVIGLDNINDYYDVSLKDYRLKQLDLIKSNNEYKFIKCDLADKEKLF